MTVIPETFMEVVPNGDLASLAIICPCIDDICRFELRPIGEEPFPLQAKQNDNSDINNWTSMQRHTDIIPQRLEQGKTGMRRLRSKQPRKLMPYKLGVHRPRNLHRRGTISTIWPSLPRASNAFVRFITVSQS